MIQTEHKNIAIFTGASSGMGRDFVEQIDAQRTFDEIWLIARRKERLTELSRKLHSPCRIFPLDLSNADQVNEFLLYLNQEQPVIDVAVNAAGFGRFGTFSSIPLEVQENMVDLNVRWTVTFTYSLLPFMHKGSELYQLGSMSSFQPVPYISVYGATKSFVLNFVRSVGREVKPLGIKMMAVCPLWVKTEFFDHAVQDQTITYYSRYYESRDVVTKALKDMKKGKQVSILGHYARFQRLMVKLLPHSLVMNTWCKQQKKP